MQETFEENKDSANKISKEEKQLNLRSTIEKRKFDYRIERRPIAWLVSLLLIVLAIIILAITAIGIFGQNSFIGGWSTFVTVVLASPLLV